MNDPVSPRPTPLVDRDVPTGAPRRFRPRLAPVPGPAARAAVEGATPTITLPLTDATPSRRQRLREGAHRRRLLGADLLAAVAALGIVVAISPGIHAALLALAPVLAVVLHLAGLYERDTLVLNRTTLDEAPRVLQLTGLFTLLVWLAHDALASWNLRPTDGMLIWTGSFAGVLVCRALARGWARRCTPAERCLLVGAPASVQAVEAKLALPHVAAEVVARVPLQQAGGLADLAKHPVHFREIVRRHRVERLVVAPLDSDAGDTLELIRVAKSAGLRVSVVPRLLEVVGSTVEFDEVEGLTMLGVRSFGLPRPARALKRAFDVAASGLLIVAMGPPMALIALAVRLGSKGPVLFRQTRVGRDGTRFEMLKFRSMVTDAEDRKGGLMHLNETDGLFKIADDPRVTRVGRLLRSTSLDELPQLFNVLRGEMSLVGPRPLVVDEDAKVAGLDRARLHLTPGMTGHWQILGSTRVPLEEMVGIDYLYVANWSLWTDMKILLRTALYVLSRRGV